MSKLYSENTTIVWNGNLVNGGSAKVTEFFNNLPSTEHRLSSLDCQPVTGNYVSANSKNAHARPPPPPRANPRAFDFFEKFWSNSLLCCQFRRSNALPVRASKRVKSPTLQACEANCGNKFCKIFSHFEFLVQLVFAPHFKQRHIPQ